LFPGNRIIPTRPAWLEIDLSAIRRNVQSTLDWVGPGVAVFSVVKANAYGHGLVPTARAALRGGAHGLAVAIPEEGISLRTAEVPGRVLVMGAADPLASDALVQNDLDAVVSTPELLDGINTAAGSRNRTARIHIKLDTGMGRVGVFPNEAPDLFRRLRYLPNLRVAGLMTHLATADEDNLTLADLQARRFFTALQALKEAGLETTDDFMAHAGNSAGAVRIARLFPPELRGAVRFGVRIGLLTYGVPPTGDANHPDVIPALSLKARVTQARTVPAGTTVSYGATFKTSRTSRLALVPLGYADGYSRALSNVGKVLLRGGFAPVVGRVCMDQFVVDATATGAEVGDEIVLLGEQNSRCITVLDMAEWAGTIHHEVLTRFGERLPRIYLHETETTDEA